MGSPSAPPPAPRRSRAPSITRLFAATFIAVALVGLVTQIATWQGARNTQAAMVALAQGLERVQQLRPSPVVAARLTALEELAADAGDNAVQAAVAASVLFVAMLTVLGLGFWYNRRRLAAPFGRVVTALERVAEGHFSERVPEDQPDEFGTIARGVNRMAAALAWREGLHEYLAQLLAALNAPPDEAASGLTQALGVIAGATHASGIALYQPSYDTNDWAATAARGIEAHSVNRATMRSIIGDADQAILFVGEAANPVRFQLRLTAQVPHGLVLAPLRSGRKLVGVLCVVLNAPFSEEARAALDQAAPNLAIAGERESAHHNSRRLATEVRLTARRLEELNSELDV